VNQRLRSLQRPRHTFVKASRCPAARRVSNARPCGCLRTRSPGARTTATISMSRPSSSSTVRSALSRNSVRLRKA